MDRVLNKSMIQVEVNSRIFDFFGRTFDLINTKKSINKFAQ